MRRFLGAVAAVAACSSPPAELDDLGPLPPFALVDQAGKPVTDQSMRGVVWAANFLFTSCPTACPPLATATAELQRQVAPWAQDGPPVRLVSISVDPMTDTPEVLTAFGRKHGADHRLWSLWTGNYETMERVVVRGFLQPLLRPDRPVAGAEDATILTQPTPLDTAHSLRFVLVDQRGHLRALYDKDPQGLRKLAAAMRWLRDHPPEE
ncbi:MAG: SCO family protein [Deltaproteobacteria bacterium]|nr:SCO family protein [Deltaproteobacteria bacterium]